MARRSTPNEELPVLSDLFNVHARGAEVVLAVVGCYLYTTALELHIAVKSSGRRVFDDVHRELGMEEETDGGPRLVLSYNDPAWPQPGGRHWERQSLGFRNAWGDYDSYNGRFWHESNSLPDHGTFKLDFTWPVAGADAALEVDAAKVYDLSRGAVVLW